MNSSLATQNQPGPPTLLSRLSCRITGSAYDLTLSEFPATVQIETTNNCNSRCLICPHQKMRRRRQNMDDNIYTKIIDECAANHCGNVHLHNFGEPLLDPKLADRIRYAKDKGLPRVKIFSNGSLLDREKARAILDAGLDEIKISFDGATKEEFEKIRHPLRFDTLISNIENLVQLRDQLNPALKITLACCSTSEKTATIRNLEQLVDGFSFGKIHNWTSPEEQTGRTKLRRPCSRIWRTFTVLADGRAAICCLDYEGQEILGDLKDQGIHQIWRSPLYHLARHLHRHGWQAEIPVCRNCTKSFW